MAQRKQSALISGERCGYECLIFRKQLCRVFCKQIFKAGCVGALWVISVLIDGDWYVCCKHDHFVNQSQLACKDKTNITAEENVIINTLKNKSKLIGFSVLLWIIVVAALMSLCDWMRCCQRKSGCCSRREVYDTMILEEGENVLNKVLKEAAKGELFKIIFDKIDGKENGNGGGRGSVAEAGNGGGSGSGNENNWIDCFDVASEMIETKKEPKLSNEQRQKLLKGPKQEPQ